MDLKNIFKHGASNDISKMDINSHRQPTRDITVMPDSDGAKVYYYVGAIYNGRPIVLGRFYSWEQANNEGKRKLPCRFEIFPLTTGDMRVATKKVKYALLNNGNVDVIMSRARHVIEPEDDNGEDEDNENY
jgi:hypothetical protein